MDQEQPSTSAEVKEIPKCFQQLFQNHILKNVSKLKSFLSSCLALIQDKDVITKIQEIIEETLVETYPKKKFNQVQKKFKTGRELRMTA